MIRSVVNRHFFTIVRIDDRESSTISIQQDRVEGRLPHWRLPTKTALGPC
jgi:hypothetical protein